MQNNKILSYKPEQLSKFEQELEEAGSFEQLMVIKKALKV